jgi:hypothetical protein
MLYDSECAACARQEAICEPCQARRDKLRTETIHRKRGTRELSPEEITERILEAIKPLHKYARRVD